MRQRTWVTIALVAVLAAGTALRLVYTSRAVPFYGPPGMDDLGTAALMSKHIVEGRELPLYFYGHGYIGALGAYVGAGAFALVGRSFDALCAAMAVFALLWSYATFLLFRRLIGELAGLIAAALVAFAPVVVLYFSTVPLIGYPPTFAFGTLALYLGVRLNDGDLTSRAEWVCLLLLAAIAGIAIWTNPLCLPYLVVAFGLLVVHVVRCRFRRGLLLRLGVAFGLLIVTLLPVIIMARARGLGEMFGLWPIDFRLVPRTARLLVTDYLPNQLLAGSPVQATTHWLAAGAYALLGLGFLVGLGHAIVTRHRQALRAALVPAVFLVVFLALFLSNTRTTTTTTRYFTPFYLLVVACVVFPFAYRRRALSAVAAVLAAILAGHNVSVVLDHAYGPRAQRVAAADARVKQRVRRVEQSGLRHVMVRHYNGQVMTFLADEKVIFAGLTRECYYPYTVSASADDQTGFMQQDAYAPIFEATLRALGINIYTAFPAEGWTVCHDFELPTERLSLVEPAAVSLVGPDGGATPATGLADHDDETTVGDRFAADSALVFDFGTPVRLCAVRFVAPDRHDYPVGYTLWGDTNTEATSPNQGPTWTELQRVEVREPKACIAGNRLYTKGDFVVMECRFPTRWVRALKVDGFRAGGGFKVWRFREVYCYAESGQGGLPDEKEAAEIAAHLERAGVTGVFCDEWLSRKIEQLPGPHPGVLPHYEIRHPASHDSRVLMIRPGLLSVVVETAHAKQAEALLNHTTLGEVAFSRRDFPHYTAFVVEQASEDHAWFPGLRWDGVTLTRTARIARADWYYRHGAWLERAGRHEQAERSFRRSFETFPGIRANLEQLAPHDEEAARILAALTPAVEAPISFPDGVSLVGYTLTPSPLVAGRPAALRLVWQLEGTVTRDFTQVFVHFLDGERRVFQADHNATFPLAPGSTVPPALVLDEHTFVVPDDAPAGALTIRLGSTAGTDPPIRLKPRTKLRVRDRAVELGRVNLRPATSD
jgi:4-amino-4-deoxy-L-arabinose transferase-like glycosyltransferase